MKKANGFSIRLRACINDDAKISVPIMLRLVWAFDWHAEVVGLLLRKPGQLHTDAFEVQADDFFVELPVGALERRTGG